MHLAPPPSNTKFSNGQSYPLNSSISSSFRIEETALLLIFSNNLLIRPVQFMQCSTTYTRVCQFDSSTWTYFRFEYQSNFVAWTRENIFCLPRTHCVGLKCVSHLLQRLRSLVCEAFSYRIQHIPLWFNEV